MRRLPDHPDDDYGPDQAGEEQQWPAIRVLAHRFDQSATQPVNRDQQAKGDHDFAPDPEPGKAPEHQCRIANQCSNYAKSGRGKARGQLFCDLARCGFRGVLKLVPVREQLCCGHRVDGRAFRVFAADQGRNIKREIAEFGGRQTRARHFKPLRHAVNHDQGRAVAVADQIGFGCGIDHALVGVAAVR